ncbi:hypothetical protein ACJIZ3_004512 [Penstemon smallii]|uniref:Vacuolar protein sorting-associated protein 26C n=1 Tax=Penstemon smallii TaxID=265156 RepID=A0ABD3S2C1_9LAMI
MAIEIKLSRFNRIYRPDETLEGKVIAKLNSAISYQSIRLTITGAVNLQVRGGSAGVVESFYGVIKPIPIMKRVIDIQSSGKISSGTTEIPFSVMLKNPKEENLEKFYETFHGGNISIQYLVTVDVVRGYLHKPLSATLEFIVESEKDNLPQKPLSPEMIIFYITQDTQRHPLLHELKSGCSLVILPPLISVPFSLNVTPSYDVSKNKKATNKQTMILSNFDFVHSLFFPSLDIMFCLGQEGLNLKEINIPVVPRTQNYNAAKYYPIGGFRVTGKICTQCSLSDPIGGELTVESSAVPIQSIDIHLLRVESILIDGDVCRSMTLPIYIIVPRLLTCPTIFAGPFSVEFKVCIVITFVSNVSMKQSKSDPIAPKPWLAMESVPLELVRTT